MFYNYNLMTNSPLSVAWRYAHRQQVVSDNVGIPKICAKIKKMVDCDRLREKRLSLRTSALLVNGTARLYNEELDTLLQDCIQLNSQMNSRRSQDTSLADDNNSGSTSEENLGNSKNENRNRSVRSRRFKRKNNLERSHTSTKGSRRDLYGSSAMTSFISDQAQSYRPYTIEKADAETQTIRSYLANKREKEKCKCKQTTDVNSPAAVTMVYDEFTNLPSKIMCANMNNKYVKFP